MPGTYRQSVPRPPGAERVGPAPWTLRPAEDRMSVPISRVRAAFADLGTPPASDPPVTAAVLVAFQEREGEATVILTRRADDIIDPGHISFPGGHIDPGEDPIATAVREAEEEVGLDHSLVEVIGALPPVGRGPQPLLWVLPVIGIVSAGANLVPDPTEVDAIFEVPIAALAADGVGWLERWSTQGFGSEMVFFAGLPGLTEDLIWGLSARVLAIVLSTIFPSPVAAPE